MISRRSALSLFAATCLPAGKSYALGQNDGNDELLATSDDLSIADLTKVHPFGSHPASKAEVDRAQNIIANTPTGPRPIDIAQSLYDKFYKSDPHVISRWPKSEAWNPLITTFFEATSQHTKQDTVAWCAAFINWCLERSHRPSTKDSGSQSFTITKLFKVTEAPVEGDIAVFTCYERGTKSSLGIGHVTFFKRFVDGEHFMALGGNQSGMTPSIISEKSYPMSFASHRTVDGTKVPVDYQLNRFLHVS